MTANEEDCIAVECDEEPCKKRVCMRKVNVFTLRNDDHILLFHSPETGLLRSFYLPVSVLTIEDIEAIRIVSVHPPVPGGS